MFDLRALKYFVAAYEERSITGAAKRSYIAQPSISAAIQNLESSLGTQLFERAKNGLTPTADGEKLYPRAKALLAESLAILHGFREPPQREMRVRIQDDLPVHRAGPLIAMLYEHLPTMKLKLTQEGEAFDLKLVSESCRLDTEWMQLLWEEDYVVIVPDTHPLRFKTHFELTDLNDAPLIERPYCVLHQMFTQLLIQKNIRPDIRASATREEAVLGLVELGVGISVVPQSHCDGLKNVVIRPISFESDFKRRVGLACAATNIEMIALIGSMTKKLTESYA
ncbi:LysR family transcriptional regulator [Noviherbaspirillum saxi]|nr:LysR family transcriptional regulator [Noviherbaspirillum saxi]